jgi:hypothetical protein
LAMMATIVRMFREVHHDMQQGLQFGEFIDPEGAAARRQAPASPSARSMSLSLSKSVSRSKMVAEQPNGYMSVTTPKGSELPTTFANRLRPNENEEGDAQPSASAAYLSVVVARERTNPLCQ